MTCAVIFTSKRTEENDKLYYQHNNLLEEKIKSIPGYIKHFGSRNKETRQGVTVVYFENVEAIKLWRNDLDHLKAKSLAKSHFYEWYTIEIVTIEREYKWNGINSQ